MWQRITLLFIPWLFVAMTSISWGKNGGRVGQFKGYAVYNQHIMARMLDKTFVGNRAFQFSFFFGETLILPNGLAALLGMYNGTHTNNDFRNGTPHALNMMLWYLSTHAFASRIRHAVCDDKGPVFEVNGIQAKLAPGIFAALQTQCMTGDVDERRRALTSLWMDFFAFDLPEEEFSAYVDFFTNSARVQALSAAERTEQAVLALLMHPLFLLER